MLYFYYEITEDLHYFNNHKQTNRGQLKISMERSLSTIKTRFRCKSILVISFVLICSLTSTAQSRWNAITVGLANPTGAFYQNNLTLPFDKAVGAKPGWYTSFEGAFYFKESGKLNLGLSYMVSLASNGTNWDKWVSGSTSYTGKAITSMELKVGLIATYLVSGDLQIDGFVRLGDNLAWGGSGKWTTSAGTTNFSATGFGAGYGANLGVNARFHRLLGTFQYKTGSVTKKYSLDSPAGFNTTSYKMPISSFYLGIGFLISSH